MEEIRSRELETNEHCPKDRDDERRSYGFCQLLREVVEILEEAGKGFSKRVYLASPKGGGRRISIGRILLDKDENTMEAFRFYFKPHGDLAGFPIEDYMGTFRSQISKSYGDRSINKYTQLLLPEIKKYFGEIRVEDLNNWRYMVILRRLAENGGEVVFRPGILHQYYHFIKTPKKPGLLTNGIEHFYFSGGSKWAGWKDGKYIFNFSDALEEYLPRRAAAD